MMTLREHLFQMMEIEKTLDFWKKEFHNMSQDLWSSQKECQVWKEMYEQLLEATGYNYVDTLVKAYFEREGNG